MDASLNLLLSPVNEDQEFMRSVDPFIQPLKAYCISLCQSKWDGEDLFQETMIKALKKWRKDRSALTKAYVYRIASNTWIDAYRKKKPELAEGVDLTLLSDQKLEANRDVEAILRQALTRLTSKQQAVFLLSEGYDMSHKKIAQLLDCREGSVRAALYRARKKIESITLPADCISDQATDEFIKAFYTDSPEWIVDVYKKSIGMAPQCMALAPMRMEAEPYALEFFLLLLLKKQMTLLSA